MRYKILTVIMVVLALGCINTGSEQSTSGGGMEIKDFTIMPENPDDTDEVSFLVEAKNTGSVTAECVRGDIYGLGGWRNLGGENLPGFERGTFWNLKKDEDGWSFDLEGDRLLDSLGVTDWTEDNVQSLYQPVYDFAEPFSEVLGLPEPEQISMEDNFNFDINWEEGEGVDFDIYWDVFSRGVACNPMTFHSLYTVWGNETFYSQKEDLNEPGQVKNTEWRFIPPDLMKGVSKDFDVIFRLTYTYKTTGAINFPVKTKEEIERSGPPSDSFNKDESDSPVTLNLIDGEFPMNPSYRDYELSGGRYEYYPLTFQLQNVGNGFPVLPFTQDRERTNGIILGWIEVEGPGVTFSNCLGEENTNKVNIDASSGFQKLQKVKLRSDGTSQFGCTVKLDRKEWENRDKGTISIVYRFGYTYSMDKRITVPVQGT